MQRKPVYAGAVVSFALLLGVIAVREARSSTAPAWTDHPGPSKIQQPTVETKHQLFSEDHTADVVAIQRVWSAYVFYNDSINGPGVASLFTPDGVDQHLWVSKGRRIRHKFRRCQPG
jgi:hypothetical protein